MARLVATRPRDLPNRRLVVVMMVVVVVATRPMHVRFSGDRRCKFIGFTGY